MELVEKVQELQAIKPPLDIDEINRRIQEWKESTGYKAPEEIEVKEVKTQGAGNNQDANQTPIPDASEKLTFYDGTSESEEDDDAPLNPSIFSDYLNVPLPNFNFLFELGKLKDYSPKYKFDKPYNVFEYDHDFNDLHKKIFGVDIKDTLVEFHESKPKEKPKTQAELDAEFFGEGTSVFLGQEEREVVIAEPARGLEVAIVGDDKKDEDPVDEYGLKQSTVDRMLRNFKEAEALQPEQFNALRVKIFDNKDLFTPIVSEFTTGGGGSSMTGTTGSQTMTSTYQPYEEELKLAEKQLTSGPRKIDAPEPTQQEIEDRAREIIFRNESNKFRNQNGEIWLENIKSKYDLNTDTAEYVRERMLGVLIEDTRRIENNIEKFESDLTLEISRFEKGSLLNNFEVLTIALNKSDEKLKDLKQKILTAQKKGKPTQSLLKRYQKTADQYNARVKGYNEIRQTLEKENFAINEKIAQYTRAVGNLEDSATQLDTLGRIYDKVHKRATDFALSTSGLLANTFAFAERIADFITPDDDINPTPTFFRDFAEDVAVAKEVAAKKFQRPVAFEDAFKSWSNFADFSIDQAIQQGPIFAAIASGNVGMAAVSMSSAGEYDTRRRMESKQEGGRAYNKNKVFFQSLGYGASEFVFGAGPTYLILKGVGKTASNATKRELLSGWKNYFANSRKNLPLDLGLTLADAGGEYLTNGFQNSIDGVNFNKGGLEAFTVGGMFATTFSGFDYAKGAITASLSDYDTYSSIRAKQKMVDTYYSNSINPLLNKAEQKASLKEATKLQKEVDAEIQARIDLQNNNLNSQGGKLLINAINNQERLRSQAENVSSQYDAGVIDKATKDALLKDLSFQFNEIGNGIDNFKKAFINTFTLLSKKDQKRLKQKAKQQLEYGSLYPSGDQIARRAEQLHVEEKLRSTLESDKSTLKALAGAGIDVNYSVEESNKNAIAKFTEMMNKRAADSNNSITDEQAQAFIKRFTDGINKGTLNGINIPSTNLKTGKRVYDSVTSVQNSIANERSQTSLHELGHVILTEALGLDPKAFKEGANLILSYLKETNPEAYTRINERTRGQGADEVFTVFFEEVADGRINVDKSKGSGFLGALGWLMNDATSKVAGKDYNYNFKGETDIVEFAKQVGKKLANNTLTVGDVKTIQEEGLAGKKETPVTSIAPDQDVDLRQAASTEAKASEEVTSPVSKAAVNYQNNQDNMTEKQISSFRDQYFKTGVDALKRWAATKGVPVSAITNPKNDIQGKLLDQFPSIMKNYKPVNPATKKKQEFTTYLDRILGRRIGTKLVEDFSKGNLETVSIEESAAAQQIQDPDSIVDTATVETTTDNIAKKPTETTRFNKNYIDTEFAQNNDISKEGVETKITETVTESFKDRPVKNFKDTGKIPQALAKLYADLFGIKTVNALIEKQRNLQKLDEPGAIRARQFLIDNAAADFARLPRVKDDLGKATGIFQTKLGKVMYNKNGKLVGTLKQYKDIIQGKKITLPDYNGNEITFNARDAQGKKKPIYRDSQHITAALDFHIRNRALETLVPLQGKRVQLGAKFSEEVSGPKSISIPASSTKLKDAALKSSRKITGGLLKNYTVKDLLEKGYATIADIKNLYNLPLKQSRIVRKKRGGKIVEVVVPSDMNKPIKSSGYRVLDAKKTAIEINNFLEKFPKYFSVFRSSTTNSLERSLMGSPVVFDLLVDKPKGVYETLERDVYKIVSTKSPDYNKLSKKFVEQTKKSDYLEGQYAKLKYFENFWMDIQTYLSDFKGDEKIKKAALFDELLTDAASDMGSILRISPPILYLPLNSKGQVDLNVEIREEHNFPQNQIGSMMLQAAIDGNVEQAFKIVSAAYMQGPVTMKDDGMIDVDYKFGMPDFFWDTMVPRILSGDLVIPEGSAAVIRLSEAGVNLDTYQFLPENQTFSEYFFGTNGLPVKTQNALLKDFFSGKKTLKQTRDYGLDAIVPDTMKSNVAPVNNEMAGKLSIENENSRNFEDVINELNTLDKALNVGRKYNNPVKKARIFDFDDTLARSNSKVIVTLPFVDPSGDMVDIVARRLFKEEFKNRPSFQQKFSNLNESQQAQVLDELQGETFEINATEFAEQAGDLESRGADFDFSQFEKVIDGKKGPLFDVAKTIADKRGAEDIFILTARPQAAAGPIQQFMKALGIDIPIGNITGLGDGKASAKGRWVAGKAAEGYNDFYFADDAIKNVEAVKEVLDQLDVKSKVQQAKFSNEKTFNNIVNDMIQDSSGIESYKTFSAAKARTVGENKGRFDWLTMASSAEDFKGLLYSLLGKGKRGEAQYEFLKTNLIDTYNQAEDSITQAKVAAANDFMALKSQFPGLPKTLETQTGVGKFNYQHALRVYMWTKQGMSIPGLSKSDVTKLNKFITDDTSLQVFADQLISIQKGKPYPEPDKNWLGGNLTTDIIGGINKVNRAQYQQQWLENVNIIFSPENLNKMEAAYGTRWRKALENTLERMKAGTNRLGYNDQTSAVLDWVNNSVGAVMFLNTRSALLQTISAVNFINWGDNNIIKAGAAFANQKQFWGDFMTLMNSDYLVQRRNGLKINVSESEIADAVKDSKNKVKSAIAFLLSKGFVLTRYADSFAIASGGATFYRNRIKKYLKEGMNQKLAEEKAFQDFRQIAEESQQSSSPDKISMQQASAAGRVILNWANTPMQYVRIQKRSIQDLIAGRGDAKTHISRIAYYGVIQNVIFNALQQALFAIGFGDDDDEKKQKSDDKKIARVANGMIDSQLKGLGIAGAGMVAVKNTLMKIYEESGKNRPEYEKAAIEALSFSPAISSKYRKIVGGLKSFSWNMKEIKEKGFSLDNPAYLAGAQIITAATNIPIDRVIKKANNIRGIMSEQSQMWQKVSMALGWSSYDVGLPYYGGWDKPVEPTEEEIKKQEFDKLKKDTKTQDQIDMLLNFGLTKKEIKALGKEDARVNKIIELQNKPKEKPTEITTQPTPETKPKPKPKPKPKVETAEQKLRRQFDSIKAENKPDQVKTLTRLGLTKKEIRDLRYEKNRVEKILELMDK